MEGCARHGKLKPGTVAGQKSQLFPEMIADGFRLHPGHNCGQSRGVRLLDGLEAAEVFEKAASGALAHAGNFQ